MELIIGLIAVVVAGAAFVVGVTTNFPPVEPPQELEQQDVKLFGAGEVLGMLGEYRIYSELEAEDGRRFYYHGLDTPVNRKALTPPYLITNGMIYVPILGDGGK